jgi:hypothetical protein
VEAITFIFVADPLNSHVLLLHLDKRAGDDVVDSNQDAGVKKPKTTTHSAPGNDSEVLSLINSKERLAKTTASVLRGTKVHFYFPGQIACTGKSSMAWPPCSIIYWRRTVPPTFYLICYSHSPTFKRTEARFLWAKERMTKGSRSQIQDSQEPPHLLVQLQQQHGQVRHPLQPLVPQILLIGPNIVSYAFCKSCSLGLREFSIFYPIF